ncbi:hypothetical protein [Streptomyces sp.]|uniref:hypothetical protein n=2 Tax=unclassified Streptomyces TaxID=2593676 RepID=UPI002D7A359F|nr:hypothetical protein [Streptomyces sp.]HET6357245.1 hypothetical protein [Streptomyces sp.]
MKRLQKYVARIALATSISATIVLGAPSAAQAGTCTSQGCGGEVSNNSGMSIRITNCWRDSYGVWENGDKLSCVTHPNSWSYYNADVELPVGGWSSNHYYYYDTDAIRFYKGCVTRYHFWGGSIQTEDRRGKDSIWRKIYDVNHVYIDSISC